MKYIFKISLILLLIISSCTSPTPPKKTPEPKQEKVVQEVKEKDESKKCYVIVQSDKKQINNLYTNISVSIISQYVKKVEKIPLMGLDSSEKCIYEVSFEEQGDTLFTTISGEGLNSYGDSKLFGSDGFQQSLLKSLYRSLRDKRKMICEDYGSLLEECGSVVSVRKREVQKEKCYLIVVSNKKQNIKLFTNISVSIVSQYVTKVEKDIPRNLDKSDSCIYEISIEQTEKTLITTVTGEGLNSYGDSKLSGIEGFQQSLLKSLYRSLEDKRKKICEDYGELLEKCGSVVVQDIPKQVEPKVGMFVTVGQKGTILTSSDGISWTSRESGTSEHLHGITNKNGVFVTVGGKGIILTSSDGISWTSRYGTLNGNKSSAWLFGIGHGNGLFVAVGDKGTIFTSLDGTQWTSRNVKVDMYGDEVPITEDDFKGITFINRIFVAVSWERTIWTSLDGNIWTKRTLKNTKQIGPLQSATFGGDTFVIVGFDQTILTSKDGINWTQQRSGLNHINDIIYKNGKFLTFENNGKIKSSIDTLRWKSMDTGTKFHLNGGSFGKGRFVVVAENGEILSSLDGIGWTSNISGTSNILWGVTYKE